MHIFDSVLLLTMGWLLPLLTIAWMVIHFRADDRRLVTRVRVFHPERLTANEFQYPATFCPGALLR